MSFDRATLLCLALIIVLFGLQFVLPEYERLILTRVLVLAAFAVGYNILYGYTGLLSLGHAMFFASGLYAAGLPAYYLGWSAPLALLSGIMAGLALAFIVGVIALRTRGVAFFVVTTVVSPGVFFLGFFLGGVTPRGGG